MACVKVGIPLVLLITLGLLSVGNHDLASATDPIAAIRNMLPAWMAVPDRQRFYVWLLVRIICQSIPQA